MYKSDTFQGDTMREFEAWINNKYKKEKLELVCLLFSQTYLFKKKDNVKKELKLFVWTGFSPDYTDGLAFAIAEDAAEAMKLVEENRGFEVCEWGKLAIYPLDKIAKSVCGGA